MAIGFPNKGSRPEGRKAFSEAPSVVKSEIVRSGKHSDGQDLHGTPAGRESTQAGVQRYADGTAYRADMRGQISRGLTDRLAGEGPNPTVHSKNTKRYGRDGSRLDGATFKSTGDQPASQHRDEVPPSLPQRTYTERVPPGAVSRRVGWPGGGRPFVQASHAATMRKPGSDSPHDPAKSTDNAPGQAHAASGGAHGQPQIRPPRTPRTGVGRADTGALDRASYTGGKYPGSK